MIYYVAPFESLQKHVDKIKLDQAPSKGDLVRIFKDDDFTTDLEVVERLWKDGHLYIRLGLPVEGVAVTFSEAYQAKLALKTE